MPANPTGVAQMSFDLAPAEGHRAPDLVIGQESPAHPIIYCPQRFPESPRDLRFVDEFFRQSNQRSVFSVCDTVCHRHFAFVRSAGFIASVPLPTRSPLETWERSNLLAHESEKRP